LFTSCPGPTPPQLLVGRPTFTDTNERAAPFIINNKPEKVRERERRLANGIEETRPSRRDGVAFSRKIPYRRSWT